MEGFLYEYKISCPITGIEGFKFGSTRKSTQRRADDYCQKHNLKRISEIAQFACRDFSIIEAIVKDRMPRLHISGAHEIYADSVISWAKSKAKEFAARQNNSAAIAECSLKRDICDFTTPNSLIEEAYEQGGCESNTVLIPCAANASWVAKNITGAVVMVDVQGQMLAADIQNSNLKKGQVSIIPADFLSVDFGGCRFDLVIGNPPFTKKNNNQKKSLWPDFLNKAISLVDIGGRVAFILPRNWRSPFAGHTGIRQAAAQGSFIFCRSLSRAEFPGVDIDIDLVVWEKTIGLQFVLDGIAVAQPGNGVVYGKFASIFNNESPKLEAYVAHSQSHPFLKRPAMWGSFFRGSFINFGEKMAGSKVIQMKSLLPNPDRYWYFIAEDEDGNSMTDLKGYVIGNAIDDSFFKSNLLAQISKELGMNQQNVVNVKMLNAFPSDFVNGGWREWEIINEAS